MSTLRGNGNGRSGLRRNHRLVGGILVVFVLFLSLTGIALNHSDDFQLDRTYVRWPWLLDAYGIEAPAPYAGRVTLGPFVVIGDDRRVHVLTTTGELVETIDLGHRLPGTIERVGKTGDRAVLLSRGALLRSDPDLAVFEPWEEGTAGVVEWSAEIPSDTGGLEALDTAWRGRGLTVERVLSDLHSGRIFKTFGRLLLDAIGIALIVLGVSGLLLARRRVGKQAPIGDSEVDGGSGPGIRGQ